MPGYRSIRTIKKALPVNMGGLVVKQPLPLDEIDQIDPFLLLHHAGPLKFWGGQQQQHKGVPPHPHRGFEPVTFIYGGGVHHRDTIGNDSVIKAGGVQWMTAGEGVVHSERPPREIVEDGGEQEFIQLWVNLPARYKMVPPRYQGLSAEDTPTITAADGNVEIQVVAGRFEDTDGPIETYSPVTALNVRFRAGGTHDFVLPQDHNAFAYLLDGNVIVNDDTEVLGERLVHLERDGEALRIEALADTRVLIMTGAPLREPVASGGPFVMNTQDELQQAIRDYQEGRMGTLQEEF